MVLTIYARLINVVMARAFCIIRISPIKWERLADDKQPNNEDDRDRYIDCLCCPN